MRGVATWDWGKLFMFDGAVTDVKSVTVSEIHRKSINNLQQYSLYEVYKLNYRSLLKEFNKLIYKTS